MASQLRIIIRVHVNTSGTTRSMQGQDILDGGAHSWPIESLDPDLSHARTNCLWFKGASVRRTGCSPGTCCPELPAVLRGPPSWPLVSTLEFRSENGKRQCVTFTDGHAVRPIIIESMPIPRKKPTRSPKEISPTWTPQGLRQLALHGRRAIDTSQQIQ